MHFDLKSDPSCFDALAEDWHDLLTRASTRVPFLRPEYLKTWWHYRGGGEWPGATLALIVARDEAQRLVGIAPLFRAINRDGRKAWMGLGAIEITDYLDLIVPAEDAPAFADGLLVFLATQMDWEVLDLYNIPGSSPTRAALAQAALAHGWRASQVRLEPMPAITLPADFETYLTQQVEKKERQEIRRKLRRAEGGEQAVRFRIVGGDDDLNLQTDALMQLMALNPDKAAFFERSDSMRAQFRETIRMMAASGQLHLAFLDVEGQPAAAYLSFDDGRRLYVYNSAIDPRYNALSAGWVLLAYLLQWAIAQGRQVVDFLRGDEDYKLRFGGIPGAIYRLQIAPSVSLSGEPVPIPNPDQAPVFPPEAQS